MRKTVLFVLATSVVLLSPAVFAEEKPAEPPKEQANSPAPAPGRKFSELTPEEQARLRQKWQNTSSENRAKVADKLRERTASRSTEAQTRRQAIVAEMARLQQQYKVAVDELQLVKQIATKENAKETVNALNGLMAKHEARYNRQLQELQQRLKLLMGEQVAKPGVDGQTVPGQPPRPPELAPKVEPKPQDPVTQPR